MLCAEDATFSCHGLERPLCAARLLSLKAALASRGSLPSSFQQFPLRQEAGGGGGGEAGGAKAGGRGHRRDEGAHGRADQAVLQPGGGHDSAAAQAAGLRVRAGKG